jgi:hypothetical protein
VTHTSDANRQEAEPPASALIGKTTAKKETLAKKPDKKPDKKRPPKKLIIFLHVC